MSVAPPITVAMPVYNGANFVATALRRIQAQEDADFEVVVRDNASTDETRDVVLATIADDPRFRYERNDVNIGGARNMNRLLDDARSPLFLWAYHDDEAHPRLLAESAAMLADDPGAVVAFPRVLVIDRDGRVIDRHDDADLDLVDDRPARRLGTALGRFAAQVQFGLMRTDVVRAAGGASVKMAGEMVLPAAMTMRGRVRLSSDEALLSLRDHPQRSGGNRRTEALWLDPNRPFVPYPYSRSTWLLWDAVAAAPLSDADKRRCRRAILWNWTRPSLRTMVGDTLRLPWDLGWVGARGAMRAAAGQRGAQAETDAMPTTPSEAPIPNPGVGSPPA